MLKRIAWVAVALAAVGVLAWPRQTDRKFPDRKPVRFWHAWSGEWKDVVDGIVADFNASQTEYEVVALSVPNGSSTKCILGVAGGKPPDVLAQWEAVIPTWAEKGIIRPFDDLMTPEERVRFRRDAYPGVLKLALVKNKIYALTPTMNQSAVYLRLDALDEAGLKLEDFPTTLEGLAAWGRKLDKVGKNGELLRMGLAPGSWRHLAPGFGGGFWRWNDPKGGLLLDTPPNERALTWLTTERKRLGYENVVRFQSGFASDSGGQWAFLAGQIAMAVDGQWRVEQIGKFAPTLRYAVRPLPPPAGGVALGGSTNGNQMVIPAGAPQPEGAMEFVRFWSGLSDPERAAKHITVGGWLPMVRSVAATKRYQAYLRKYPNFRPFLEMMDSPNVHPMPPVPYQQIVQDKIGKYEDLAMRGSLSPREAICALKGDLEAEVRRRKELGYE